ncbi:hypothetical protein [Rufibacter psychrotolerans]|uniref:hypothetical protein n=1 Tax=Rufibacter psychrotolerans TaxID=2812556 RepID=UPI0019671A1D|nr:hypothetical protein [Rufibacter sp. SYSU D00308]
MLILPLAGFLAAGCSTSSNLQTSEADDVYFSSADKVTYVEPAQDLTVEETLAAGTEDDASRDISERVSDPQTYSSRRSSSTPYQYSYYDAPFGNPFYAYHTPFYSPGRYYSRAMMYDPWLDPWYDPFYGPSMSSLALYDPFWPRTGLSIGIGLGFGRYYNPWGYGYGYGYGYNPFRYGYYDNYYGGGRVVANRVAYGRRDDRSSNAGSRNPNISRDPRGSIAAPATNRSANAVVDAEDRTRSGRVASQPGTTSGDTGQRRRRPVATPQPGGQSQQGIIIQDQSRNSRTSRSEGAQPTRRQRIEYTPAPSRSSEMRSRSYEPSRSSYEPSRSSYEPSRSSGGSSGGGSSSGGSRRGRN